MARVGLSALFTSIAGRYGGGVFRNWKGLNVLGVLPDSVNNPNSTKQVKARGLLNCCSKKWSALGVAVKEQWAAVATYLTDQWGNYENETGTHQVIRTPRGPYTALGALVSIHSLLGSVEAWDCEDAISDAPVGVTAPSNPLNLAASGDTDGIDVTWDDPASWGVSGNAGYVRIWAKSENGAYFAQLSGSVAAATEAYEITELVPAGGDEPIVLKAGLYFIQADAVNAEGLRSAPSAVVKCVIAAPPV